MKQNLDESNCSQLSHNNSRVPNNRSRHWEFNLSSHRKKFNLSHVPNAVDTNRMKVVRQCSQEPGGVIWSVVCAIYTGNHIPCLLQLLFVHYMTRWPVYEQIVTSNKINSTVYHIQLVLDEKARPDSYIRRTAFSGVAKDERGRGRSAPGGTMGCATGQWFPNAVPRQATVPRRDNAAPQ